MTVTNHEYTTLHDNGLPLCFIGNTVYNHMLYNYWQDRRECLHLTVEEAESHTQGWFDEHQFVCAVSNVSFKREVVKRLSQFDPHYFSIVGSYNSFNNVVIGQGTYIQHYNDLAFGDGIIGDHCTLGSYLGFSHNVQVGNFCHISGYCFLNYTTLKDGVVLPVRTTVLGDPDRQIEIAENCNFMTGSTVTKSIAETGTYFGNRRVSSESSVTYKIL
jgi:serine acetyltransferase